jgi:hypothetical protein
MRADRQQSRSIQDWLLSTERAVAEEVKRGAAGSAIMERGRWLPFRRCATRMNLPNSITMSRIVFNPFRINNLFVLSSAIFLQNG